MFDIESLFVKQHPELAQKHPLITRFIVAVSRLLWKEKTFQSFAAANSDASGIELIKRGFDYINFDLVASEQDLAAIPAKGPLVIVANHPLGYLDGIGLLKAVSAVRSDLKLILNEGLHNMLGMAEYTIPVDNFNGSISKRSLKAVRQHLAEGGVLMIFPSGLVSRFMGGQVSDAPWNPSFFRFALHSGAPILPVYINGRNSIAFYVLTALLQPLAAHILIIREILMMKLLREMFTRNCNRRITMHVGKTIDPQMLDQQYQTLSDKANHVRQCLYALKPGKPS